MNRFVLLVVLICSSSLAFAQEVIINETNTNRLLTWDDFKGRSDNSSPHDAHTYWDLSYSMQGIYFKGDTAKIGSFSVKLELNGKRSWVKKEKQSTYLLKHEQGHFDIGLICQREVIRQLNNTVFFRSGFQEKIQSIFSTIMQQYQLLGNTYDGETRHSMNPDAQERWNLFFAKELAK